jgi:hypothetical protein
VKHPIRLFCSCLAMFAVSSFAQQVTLHGVPLRFSLGLLGGASQSNIAADGLLASYFAPTPNIERIIGPALGLEYEVRIGRFAAVSLGARYQVRGENTKKTAIVFDDDIFPHDLSTTADIQYLTFPFVVKGGISGSVGWIFLKAGISASMMVGNKLSWVIDGRGATPGSVHMPLVGISGNDAGVLGGCEAGVSLGSHAFFVSGEYQYGLNSISSDLSGHAYNRATEVTVGYRYFFTSKR